jgi:hypothetical protein
MSRSRFGTYPDLFALDGKRHKVVVSGVLKADGLGNWLTINDAGHAPINTGTIEIVNGKIRIL